MSSATCLNKLYAIFAFVIISSCFQLSHQLRWRSDYEYATNKKKHIETFDKKTTNSQSSLQHVSWLHPGEELVFVTTTPTPATLTPAKELVFITTTSKTPANSVVYVNNKPTVNTMIPFKSKATTATPEFHDCLSKCTTTSEFNPVCATNRQVYENEQKFNCARHCGADIEIVRYGSCEGLFPVARG